MQNKVKWSSSLSTNLIKWFFILSLAPIIITSVLAYKNSSDSLYKAASSELMHSSLSYVNFIENWFYYRSIDIESWSNKRVTSLFMKDLSLGLQDSKKSAAQYIKSYNYISLIEDYQDDIVELTRQYDYVYDIFLIDPSGNILYTVAKEDDLGTNILNGKYSSTAFSKTVKETIADGKIHFSDLEFYNPSAGNFYGFLTSPIVSDSGDLIGIFAVQTKPDHIYEQFKMINSEDNGIHHYILGGKDLILRSAITDDKEILKRVVKSKQTDLYQKEHIHNLEEDHTFGEENNIYSYEGASNDAVIGLHHPIDILGVKWVLISEMRIQNALKSSHNLAIEIIIIVLLAMAIVAFVAIIVSRRITRPIFRLAEASQSIASGKREPILIDEKNEIGVLADAFNDMIKDLKYKEETLYNSSKKTSKALHDLKEQKYALDAHSIVSVTDLGGKITYTNKKFEEISGYSQDELIGKNHRMISSGEHSKEFWEEMFMQVRVGFTWQAEVKNIAKDGSFYWLDTTIIPFLDDNGKPESFIAIRTDITAQKLDKEELIKAKDLAEAAAIAKSEFLASMSHEIRTPMNGVIGMLGLLKNSKLDKTQKHQASLAESSALSLLTLINDILDFSKVEAGKMELENLEFNLRDDLGELAESMAFRAQEKELEVILDVKNIEKQLVVCDPGRLRQILTNLVGNAIKFTHEGEIIIRAEVKHESEDSGRLFVSIKDSGIGIPQDKIATLFDSFTQVDASTTRKYGGTGLGLSIVKKITELMGGSVSVHSEPGKGSTFCFDISIGLPKHSLLAIPNIDIKGKNVLIVDDNPINLEVLRSQLEHWEMNVYEASSADEAIKRCEEETINNRALPFDIALIDMHMPSMDGLELGKKLRSISKYNKMKMVMMTSLGSRADASQFAEIGFNAFFPKPTTTKDLFGALSVLIEDSTALHEFGNFITKDNLHAMMEEERWPEDIHILLVEDNMTNQIVANGILETFGLEADTANNGQEALQALRDSLGSKPYTVVLMDCQMPILDGYGASEAIRKGEAGEENKDIAIIAMTANAMKGDKEKCLSHGMDDYLSKPINPDSLKAMLKKWVNVKKGS